MQQQENCDLYAEHLLNQNFFFQSQQKNFDSNHSFKYFSLPSLNIPFLFTRSQGKKQERNRNHPHKILHWKQKGGVEGRFQKVCLSPASVFSAPLKDPLAYFNDSIADGTFSSRHAHPSIYYYPICIERHIRKSNIYLLMILWEHLEDKV